MTPEKRRKAAIDVEMEVTYDFDQQYLAEPLLKMMRSGDLRGVH